LREHLVETVVHVLGTNTAYNTTTSRQAVHTYNQADTDMERKAFRSTD